MLYERQWREGLILIFTQYATAEAFSGDVLDVLKEHEIQNNLLYRNIGDGHIMLTVKDDAGRVLLAADRTPPHPLVMYLPGNRHDEQVLAFFARSIFENGIDIDFVFAESGIAQDFIHQYGAASGKRFEPAQRLALSVTDVAMKPEKPARGRLRLASENDLYFLAHWCADFTVACSIGGYDLQAGLDSAKRLVEDEQLYVWEDGVPVSMAATHRKVTGCRFIGYVYTPPQLRGKGYASACVYTLTKTLLTPSFPKCALYIDCDNPVSNGIYERIGYRRTGIYQQYKQLPAQE